MRNTYSEQKDYVLGWLSKNCSGFKRAMTKEAILDSIHMPERTLRKIISELRNEDMVCTLSNAIASIKGSKAGIWYIPLHMLDFTQEEKIQEIEMIRKAWQERKRRALNTIQNCDKKDKAWADRILTVTQGQKSFI